MAFLTVGVGQQFATVSAAVAASHDGDTLYVQAGTYQNDFSTVNTKISIVGVGGMAHFVATVPIPNGKAFFITNNDVTFDHVEFSGAAVGSKNGAGIRQQAGNLTVTNSYFHNNQDGILGNAIAGATVTIDHSEFGFNGAGDGHSHNIYIGQIASLTVTNSYFHDASVGHELKSRAGTNILINNRFVDNNSTASYSIDLPNGGTSTIQNNFIQQGPNSQNPNIIAYAEEVATPPPGSSLSITGNTIVNQKGGSATGVWNDSTITATINGNHFYGLTPAQIASGPNSQSGNDTLPSAPVINTSHPWAASPWDNLVSGGAGADVLNGTSGHDLFVGGAGNDTFGILAGGSSDTIADFAAGAGPGDVVNLQGYNFANFAAVQAAMTQNGADTVLNLGNGETLTFKGVLTSAFAADDFNMSGASDTTPPALTATTPPDNSTNVAIGANLVLTFNESVKAGSGNLVIHNAANGSAVATIAITDASQVSFSGATLTINPTATLAPGTHYYVTLASGVVQDLAGNAYAGLSAATDFDFTTAAADTTPPTLSATTPADNSTNVAVGANLVLTFSESVKAGVGNLVIHNAADGSVVATIAITDASQASFSGATLTINPTANLAPGTHYYVTMASGVVQDLAGNAYTGLSAATDFDFTTATQTLATKLPYDFDGDGHSDILWQHDSGQAAVWLMNGTNVVTSGNVGTSDPTWHTMGAGDFDGDGKVDILLQNDNGQAAVWLMNGTTRLSSANVGSNLGTAWHVESAGDFNGDGKSDILWQNNSGQAQIWLMNGTSILSSATIGASPGTAWHVEGAADFNGDGKADILWQNDNGWAAIWLMDGTTKLLGDVAGPNMGTSWDIKGAGDFNGDGKSDILWQTDTGQATVWLMDGLTRLSSVNVGSNLGTSWHVLGAEDFNGDGKSDILWQSDSGQATVWLMNGTSVLTTSPIGANLGSSWHVSANDDVILAPLSDTTPPTLSATTPPDNSTNVAVGANLVLTFSENVKAGSGNLVIHNAANGSAVATIAITDASQVGFSGSTLTINPTANLAPGAHYYVTMGSGVVQDLAGNAYAGLSAATDFDFTTAAVADTTPPTLTATTPADNSTNVAVSANLLLTFNEGVKAGVGNLIIHNAADGSTVVSIAINDAGQVSFAGSTLTINPTADLVAGTHYYVTLASGVVQDLAGNAYAGLSTATDFDFTTAPQVAALKVRYDFDGDGHSDILWQNNSGQAAVWLMNGTNVVTSANVGTPDPTWHTKSAGDFDGDGKADILLQNDSGQAAVWLMDGTTRLSSANVGSNLGTAWHAMSAGDFNGDGKSDILWQNDSGQAQIWLMNGTNVLSSAMIGASPGTSWDVAGAGDFNGDGKSDILWQHENGQAAIWLMDGTTKLLGDLAGTNMGASWHIKGAGDFNGDGKSDILWQNDSGQAQIWLMNGLTRLSSANVGSNLGPTWHVKGAEDFNGDGKADILWQDDSGQAAVWLMNGTTVLTTGNVATSQGSPWHVTASAATGLAHGISADALMDTASQALAANPFDHPDILGGDLIV